MPPDSKTLTAARHYEDLFPGSDARLFAPSLLIEGPAGNGGHSTACSQLIKMLQQLPIPAFHAGSRKSGGLIDARNLAAHIGKARDKARAHWGKKNRGEAESQELIRK